MLSKISADTVVLIHFLWIVFLFLGAFWGIKNRVVKIFHLSGLVFALIIQVFDWFCPLTHLEVWLRSRHDLALTYAGSFIVHYVERIVYIELSRTLILVLTLMLCGLNMWLYLRKRRLQIQLKP
ncbi:MAG TPA: DUF2784 domain-containing protein [Thermodesulfobacteriota bacterium]|nr:DUF2784 domain-containing protein [Thermodesulfobacteriota bacterium]